MSQQYPQNPNQPPYDPQNSPVEWGPQGQPQQPPYPPQQPLQGPPPGWAPPPVRKKHTVRNVFIVLGILAVLGIGGCMAVVGVVGNQVNKQSTTEHSVVYKVTGTAKAALITYNTDGSTSQEQANNAPVPWTSQTLSIKGLVRIYQVSAQNSGGGSISCAIYEDGNLVKSATATGDYAIASCDFTPSN